MRLTEMSGHTRVSSNPTWCLNDIVYIKRLQDFARLIVTYEKSSNHWLPLMLPSDPEKKKADMEKYDSVKYRVCVELVVPSASQVYCNTIVWEPKLANKKVFNIVSSDGLLMPGAHFLPNRLSVGEAPKPDNQAIFTNCFQLLGEIIKKYNVSGTVQMLDERILETTVHTLGIVKARAVDFNKQIRDNTPDLQATMLALRRCQNERVKQGAVAVTDAMLQRKNVSAPIGKSLLLLLLLQLPCSTCAFCLLVLFRVLPLSGGTSCGHVAALCAGSGRGTNVCGGLTLGE